MDIIPTAIPDVLVIMPQRLGDARGWFAEIWNDSSFAAVGIDMDFVQDNHSYSAEAGTLRGLHYQAPPYAQDKLVRCTRGAIFDVAVDVRKGSPTFGRWVREELNAENGKQVFVPKGFLHGFVSLLPNSEVQYKVSNYYNAESDGSVRWDSLGIDWVLDAPPILSAKDADAPAFEYWASPFIFENSK